MTTRYKFLTQNGRAPQSRTPYALPHDGKPGEWMPRIATLAMCDAGYHSFTRDHALEWLNARLFEAQTKGRGLHDTDKSVHHEMRLVRELTNWNESTARLFASDCAADVLHLFERQYPTDTRPRHAILTTRAFVLGQASANDLAAARAAARGKYTRRFWEYVDATERLEPWPLPVQGAPQ